VAPAPPRAAYSCRAGAHRAPHSFPTRRSSDLKPRHRADEDAENRCAEAHPKDVWVNDKGGGLEDCVRHAPVSLKNVGQQTAWKRYAHQSGEEPMNEPGCDSSNG